MKKNPKLQAVLLELMNSNQVVLHYGIAPGEYSSLNSACGALRRAIKRYHFPVAVRTINQQVYLIRLDRILVPLAIRTCQNCRYQNSFVCSDCNDHKFWKEGKI